MNREPTSMPHHRHPQQAGYPKTHEFAMSSSSLFSWADKKPSGCLDLTAASLASSSLEPTSPIPRSLGPLVPMTPRPHVRNVLPKAFCWPRFYLFTEGKCHKFIPPEGNLAMTLIPNYLSEQTKRFALSVPRCPLGQKQESVLSLLLSAQLGSSPYRQIHSLGNS